MTWKDKLEIGLKEDAPYRKDNLPQTLELKGFPEPVAACEVGWEPDTDLPEVPLPTALDRTGSVGRTAELSTLEATSHSAHRVRAVRC